VDLRGRRLMVNVAHPRGDRPERGNLGPNDIPARPARMRVSMPEAMPLHPFHPTPHRRISWQATVEPRGDGARPSAWTEREKEEEEGSRRASDREHAPWARGRIEWDDWDEEK